MREIVLDTETTGLEPKSGHKIIEIGCVEIINRRKTGNYFHRYINPERDVPDEAFRVHGISTEFLQDKPLFKDISEEFLDFIGNDMLVIHNAPFDTKFINFELNLLGIPPLKMNRVVDTLIMARRKFPGSPASLDALCKRFGVSLDKREKHGALLDSELLFEVYFELCGGSQDALNFGRNKLEEKKIGSIKADTKFIAPREFKLSEEEEKSHQELVAKLKNSLWNNLS